MKMLDTNSIRISIHALVRFSVYNSTQNLVVFLVRDSISDIIWSLVRLVWSSTKDQP